MTYSLKNLISLSEEGMKIIDKDAFEFASGISRKIGIRRLATLIEVIFDDPAMHQKGSGKHLRRDDTYVMVARKDKYYTLLMRDGDFALPVPKLNSSNDLAAINPGYLITYIKSCKTKEIEQTLHEAHALIEKDFFPTVKALEKAGKTILPMIR